MDGSKFDDLARSMANGSSRHQLLKRLGATLAASVGGIAALNALGESGGKGLA